MSHLFVLVALMASLIVTPGCLQKKNKQTSQGAGEQSGAEAGAEGILECNCAALLPAATRPEFPKILRGGPGQAEFQKSCEYNANPTGPSPAASLAVTVKRVGSQPDFAGAVDEMLSLYSKTVERQDQREADIHRFTAVVDGALGKSVVGVTHSDNYFIETIEYMDSAPAKLAEPRTYLTALPTRVGAACR